MAIDKNKNKKISFIYCLVSGLCSITTIYLFILSWFYL